MVKNNFTRTKVQSLTLGEKLRGLRNDRHMQVRDLSRKINVKISYIEALEKGEYDKLPTKVYAKGFVRSYARFFGVPEEILLNLFEREYSIYNNINPKGLEEETVNRLPKLPRFVFTPRSIVLIGGFALLCAVGLYLYFSVNSFVSSPWLVIDEPVHNSVVNKNSVTIKGQTRSNSRVSINGQQIFVDVDGKFFDEINLTQGINEIVVSSINKFDKESIEKIIITAQYEVQKIIEEENKNVSIVIRAKDKPVWVSVVSDGIETYNDTIEVDDEKTFNANKNITVTSSSGLNTLVSYDGGDTFNSISEDDEIVRDWNYVGELNVEEEEIDVQVEQKKDDN